MVIFYGVQITTKQPTLTDYELGCIDGVVKWSSGRENTELWKNGIVIEDSFSEVSQEIEIEAGGSYATMSGFNITIDNAKGLSDRIKALALELVNCEIIFYTFRDGVSSQDHTGKIADWSYDENQIQIECMDSFRSIHKPLLKKTFNTDEFGIGLSSSLIGKSIPECFGYVSKAKIFPILKEEIYETICNSGGIDFDVAPCTNYTNVGASDAYKVYTVHLKTVDKIFAADELAGKFLIEVKGGSDSKKIKSNLASSGGVTQVTLYGKLGTAPIFWSATGADVTYFQITSVDITYIVSANPIYQFDTLNGISRLFTLDSTSSEFDDVSEIGGTFDIANINNSGYPGCFILSKPSNVAGDSFYQIFSPLSFLTELAQTISGGGAVTGPHPTPNIGLDMPNLRDVDISTYYEWVCTSNAGAYATLTIPFKIAINSLFLKGNFSNLLFAFNQDISFDTVMDYTVYLNVKLIDFLGRQTAALENIDRILFGEGLINAHWQSFDYIIPSEYGAGTIYTTDPHILNNLRDSLAINQSLQNLESVIDAEIYPYVVFELKYKWRQLIGSSQMTLFLNQVTIVGEKKLNLITTDLYSKLRGGLFGSDWDGRRTYNLPAINIADMIELIIRNFDERPDVIDTTSFDLLGNPTTGLLKNNRIGWQQTEQINSFDLIDKLCLFSFTGLIPKNNGKRALKRFLDVTVVATHNDTNNTILENSIGEKKPTSLANVFNAPQINYAWNPATEKFDSFLQIKRLDEDSFPLESTSVSSTFNESFFSIYKLNSVYPGMIQFVITSGPSYSIGDFVTFGGGYNGLTLYGTEVLVVSSDSIFVSDPGTFGLALGTDYTGGSLIKYTNPKKVWPTYAIGYNDDEYNEAKENWRLCKLSVTRYGFTRELPSEMSDCKYFPNMEKDWSFPAQYSAAKAYMRDLCRWTPFRKEVVPYRLPNTAVNASLELLDGITFANSNDNAGTEETGRIVGKTIVPGLGKDYIGIQLMLNPKTT